MAFTEKSARSKVCGKSLSSVIFILVLSVGFADAGSSVKPDLMVDIVEKESEFVTT